MYVLEETEDYTPTKITTDYTFFALSILVSFCIHLFIVLFISDTTYSCFDCYKVPETNTLSIQLYKEPEFQPKAEKAVDVIEQPSEPFDEIIKSTVTEQKPPKPIMVETTPTLSKINKINYATINSSIESIVYEDSQKYRQAWQDSCEDMKKTSVKMNCVPTIERLGYNTEDPYNLSKIFNRLSNNSSSKQQERIIAQLIYKQDTITAILENENIDKETKAIFSGELAFLRSEVYYQDCDGNLNSGNCAGEADLFKAASLLLTIFEKVVVD